MKLRKVKIIVEDVENTSRRWTKALKGKSTFKSRNTEIISVSTWDILGKVFSSPRMELLSAIVKHKPESIAALSRIVNRDFKNVHSDVKFLADLGLIELKEKGPRKTLVPVPMYDEIEVGFAA